MKTLSSHAKYLYLIVVFITISLSALSQSTFRYSNKFSNSKFSSLLGGEKYDKTEYIASSLKGYITKLSEDKDTMFIEFWSITDTTKESDHYFNNPDTINACNNGETFAYIVPEDKNSISVPFSAWVASPVSIPLRYRLKSKSDLEADFLTAGFNWMRIWGKTKFYRQAQIDSRQNYWGGGFFAAISQQKVDSSNTRGVVEEEHNVAAISYGINVVKSWNTFNVTLAFGCDNAIGYYAQHWEENNFKYGFRPWIGFGVGFKLFELGLKDTNSKD
jgi:hypothetical protein